MRGEKEESTYAYLRIRLQREGSKTRLVLIGGGHGQGILGGDAQRQLLTGCRNARDGFEAGLEVGDGPRRRNATFRRRVGRANKERDVGGALERHCGGRLAGEER